jgi:phosphotriesterase-related protein
VAPGSVDRHAAMTLALAQRGVFGRVLVSHDAGWYRVGEPGGAPAKFRGFDAMWTAFIPALRAQGLSEAQVASLLTEHPRRVLSGEP